jgi:hypothetical protein
MQYDYKTMVAFAYSHEEEPYDEYNEDSLHKESDKTNPWRWLLDDTNNRKRDAVPAIHGKSELTGLVLTDGVELVWELGEGNQSVDSDWTIYCSTKKSTLERFLSDHGVEQPEIKQDYIIVQRY